MWCWIGWSGFPEASSVQMQVHRQTHGVGRRLIPEQCETVGQQEAGLLNESVMSAAHCGAQPCGYVWCSCCCFDYHHKTGSPNILSWGRERVHKACKDLWGPWGRAIKVYEAAHKKAPSLCREYNWFNGCWRRGGSSSLQWSHTPVVDPSPTIL